MQSEQSQVIIKRFIITWLCLEKEPERDIFQVAWLENLVNDYKVSSLWLLTGNGAFFSDDWNFSTVKSFVKSECKKTRKRKKDCKQGNTNV